MPNKCTLIIDGNWLLISRFSVMNKLFKADLPQPALEAATNNLLDMMAKSINITINRFPDIDNVVLVSDGGSWRKQLPVPEQLKGITYKGNREEEKSSDFSWPHIFKALNRLSKECESVGMTVCTQANIEGDDWAWYWSRRLNDEGTSCIIWTSDNDLKQLVQNKGGVFTAWYNDKNGIFFPESLQEKVPDPDDLDCFMTPMVMKPMLMENLIRRSQKTSYVDPNTIINGKIICGDSGDNIKSVIQAPKGDRIYGVGPKDWQLISNAIYVKTVQDLITKKDKVASYLCDLNKFRGVACPGPVMEHIDYNIKLVWLSSEVIPSSIVDVMNTVEYKQVDVNYLRGSYKVLCEKDDQAQQIFADIF